MAAAVIRYNLFFLGPNMQGRLFGFRTGSVVHSHGFILNDDNPPEQNTNITSWWHDDMERLFALWALSEGNLLITNLSDNRTRVTVKAKKTHWLPRSVYSTKTTNILEVSVPHTIEVSAKLKWSLAPPPHKICHQALIISSKKLGDLPPLYSMRVPPQRVIPPLSTK